MADLLKPGRTGGGRFGLPRRSDSPTGMRPRARARQDSTGLSR